ncbi:Arc family DNA-binding protein [Pseudomonas sp. RW10S2]|nr:Arc family DNA-binding protein [Pseudomonas sp. RW10S2]
MSRTDPQFNLRIPEALRDKVMAAAKDNKRSATAEILARLEGSFSEQEGFDGSRAAGPKKDMLVIGADGPGARPITRAEIWDVLGQAIEQALDEMTIGSPPDGGPSTSSRQKPRTGRPKK